VIPSKGDHRAVETGYYKATDIAKQGNPNFFSQRLIFEALKTANQEWKKHIALQCTNISNFLLFLWATKCGIGR